MDAQAFNQLVRNLKVDGALTSAPLIYRDRIVSGHHRVRAAIEAGIESAICVEIITEIPEDRIMALQLSHNAINGKDDAALLAELYQGLGLAWKQFSGLSDDAFKAFDELNIDALSAGAIKYQELMLTFLPEKREQFEAFLKRIGNKTKIAYHVATLETFDAVFDAVVRVKGRENIHNSAQALHRLAVLACERLDQLDANERQP